MSEHIMQNTWDDPRCYHAPNGLWNTTVSLINNGGWQVTLDSGQSAGAVVLATAASGLIDEGMVIFAQTSARLLGMGSTNVIWRSDDNTMTAGLVARAENRSLSLNQSMTVYRIGVYTQADWEALYKRYEMGRIALPWVAGPRNGTWMTINGKRVLAGPYEL